ncbi:MAG: hypothetical protein ABIQ57_09005 [Candidatus Kapaibacterium sp.]
MPKTVKAPLQESNTIPRRVLKQFPPPRRSIGRIPLDEIVVIIRGIVTKREGVRQDALIVLVAEKIGYGSSGSVVIAVIKKALDEAVRRAVVYIENGGYLIDCRNIADYPSDLLREFFLSAVGRRWRTRDEAIHAAAEYLGFQKIAAAMRAQLVEEMELRIRSGELLLKDEKVRWTSTTPRRREE